MGDRGSKNLTRNFAISMALIFSLFVTAAVYAQVSGATLSGTVTDASGSAVPNATVSIKNTATGIVREVTTDAAGFYTAPNLPPAVYDVTSSAQGFSTEKQTGTTLTVGAQQILNFSLSVGQMNQTVEVTSEAPQVELTSTTVSNNVSPTAVEELPLNGRDWSALSALGAGVNLLRTQQSPLGGANGLSTRGNRGFGNELSIGGHRPSENNYRVNGISVNDYSNSAPGDVLGYQLGVDAIQEFSVLTANYTAEYGRTAGGVINAVTKAGADDFHGTAYWFLRDDKLDARNFFDPPAIPPFHRNQFGGAAGGPIRKNKTFFFADFEGIRQDLTISGTAMVPSPAARGIGSNGQPTVATLCLPNPANPTGPCVEQPLPAAGAGTALNPAAPNPDPVTHIDEAVEPFLALYPLPNGGLIGAGDIGRYLVGIPQPFSENYETARIDQHFSDKDDLDVVFLNDRGTDSQPDIFSLANYANYSGRIMFGVEETHTFSASLVNTARVGYSRTHGFLTQAGAALSPLATNTSLSAGSVPGVAPSITGTGLTNEPGGVASAGSVDHIQNSVQFYDDAFLTHGAHSLKFGFAYEHIEYWEHIFDRLNGGFTFKGTLDSFLTNEPLSFIEYPTGLSGPGQLPPAIPQDTLADIFAGYVQDNWRFRPSLTLNFGLRYEMSTMPTERHNNYEELQCLNPSCPVMNVVHLFQNNPTRRNFEPRVGFAWDPFRDGKTSVRGGFGIFDILPLPWVTQVVETTVVPFTTTYTNSALPVGSFPLLGGVPLGPSSAIASAPQQILKRNYAMDWNLTVQRQITKALTATVGYVGMHSLHSPFTMSSGDMVSAPQVVTTTAGGGYLWPCGPNGKGSACAVGFLPTGTAASPIASTVSNPNVGNIKPMFWGSSSSYNGLQTQLISKLNHGLLAQASFTWSKCFDNSSSGNLGNDFLNSLSSLIYFTNNRAPCDFDTNKNFVGNLIYEIPSPKHSSRVVSTIAGGWQVGGIFTASSGSPFSVIMSGDVLGEKNGDPYDFPSLVPGCNPVASNWRTTLQYVNLSCFTPATAPASMAAQCAVGSFPAATVAAPSGTVYCQNLIGDAGRNSMVGPGIVNLDFSITKNTRLTERFNLQFRTEMFNIFNHPEFQSPIDNRAIFSTTGAPVAGAGLLDTTTLTSRQIQLSLRLNW